MIPPAASSSCGWKALHLGARAPRPIDVHAGLGHDAAEDHNRLACDVSAADADHGVQPDDGFQRRPLGESAHEDNHRYDGDAHCLPGTWTFTYNGFGQILTAKGPRTDLNSTTTYQYYTCTTGYQCGRVETADRSGRERHDLQHVQRTTGSR